MAGLVGMLFRRDRLTGQVAVGLVGVLVIAARRLRGRRRERQVPDRRRRRLADRARQGPRRARQRPGGKVDGRAAVVPQMRGHNIKIVQDGSTVLIVDLDTGVVSRLDPAQLNIGTSRPLGAGLQVLAGAGKAYTVDSVKGVVQQIDPVSLAPVGASAALPPVLGQAGIDARGTLWVPVSRDGQVSPFADGRLGPPVRVGGPGDALALTIAAGEPVVTNATAATATAVKPSGGRLTLSLPTTVRQAGRGGVLAPPATEGRTVPLLVPGTGSLITVDTGTGRYSSARLAVPRHRYRAPQMLGPKVYIPDETAGALLVYDAAANRFEEPVRVTGRPATLDVFVRDGMLWAHDPSGPRAVVVDERGGRKSVDKYKDRVAGGPNRRAIPLPGGGRRPAAGRPAVRRGRPPRRVPGSRRRRRATWPSRRGRGRCASTSSPPRARGSSGTCSRTSRPAWRRARLRSPRAPARSPSRSGAATAGASTGSASPSATGTPGAGRGSGSRRRATPSGRA
ncbi:hypothetical protein LUX33_10540 [Actinomadura madurae]|uniref:hypothetical protein n=1 Tax=Actinomadura madurae TaxID=1993 RepID=UPI0020D252DF|nr:hypothetical protein [Actinomadura madurae]MCP9948807.1 hypothetical protein [Actinomadura madurae]